MGWMDFWPLNNRRRSRRKLGCRDKYSRLEPRRLLASIYLDNASGDLYISGGNANDTGSLTMVGSSQVQASITGADSQTFASNQIQRVVFIGLEGNDTFTNDTAIPSLQYGQGGNDTLRGGTGVDTINGGPGNDFLDGQAGNDRLVGYLGADEIIGGDGDDSIYGGSGNNTLRGNAGNDLIFGGDDVDNINGGDGIDTIVGFAGNDTLNSGNGGVPGSAGINQADLVLGMDGDDNMIPGNGLNVFYGGNGDDTMRIGTSDESRFHGQEGDDQINGANGSDFLNGGPGDDLVRGNNGADFLINGEGDDTVVGGPGVDEYRSSGQYRQYRINGNSVLSVRDMRDGFNQGTDQLSSVDRLRFSDGLQDAVSPIKEQVVVRPIVVSNSNGGATAQSFGTAATETYIKNIVDDLFYQALVDVSWQSTRTWNNTFANQGNGGTRPINDIFTVVTNGDQAGVGAADPTVVDLYFVNIVPGSPRAATRTLLTDWRSLIKVA